MVAPGYNYSSTIPSGYMAWKSASGANNIGRFGNDLIEDILRQNNVGFNKSWKPQFEKSHPWVGLDTEAFNAQLQNPGYRPDKKFKGLQSISDVRSDLPGDYFAYRTEAMKSPINQAKKAIGNPQYGWKQLSNASDNFALKGLGLAPGSNPSQLQRFTAGAKSAGNLTGLGGALNIAGAGLSAFSGYNAARGQGEDINDALIAGLGSGVGSFGGAMAGAGFGALFGPASIVTVPLGAIAGSIVGEKGLNALASNVWDATPWGESPAEVEQKLFDDYADKLIRQQGLELELAREFAAAETDEWMKRAKFEEALAQEAAKVKFQYDMAQMALEGQVQQNLMGREMQFQDLMTALGSLGQLSANQSQLFAQLYG